MTHQYMELKIKELEKRIKALEQQSCDNAINHKDTLKAMIGQLAAEATLYKVVKNMPPVTLQPKVDLDKIREEKALDKIRAEIEQDAFKDVNGSKYIFVNRINQIIDKYTESEDKE